MKRLASVLDQVGRAPPLLVDGMLAAGLLAYGVISLRYLPASGALGASGHRGISALTLLTVTVAPLAFRRRAPRAVFAFITATQIGLAVFSLEGTGAEGVSFYAAMYTAAASPRTRRPELVLLPMASVLMLNAKPWVSLPLAAATLWGGVFWSMIWFAGYQQHQLHDLARSLGQRAYELERERDRLAAQAVEIERRRIAAELRAIVAHGVSRMLGQAKVAAAALPGDRLAAEASITTIESLGRETLAEMRRLLGLLRRTEPAESSIEANRSGPTEEAPPAPPNRLQGPTRKPFVVDLGLLLVLGGTMAFEIASREIPGVYDGRGWALGAIILATLMFRRRAPLAIFLTVASEQFAQTLIHAPGRASGALCMWIAIYTLTASRGRRWGGLAVVIGGLVQLGMWGYPPLTPPLAYQIGLALLLTLEATFFAILGSAVREIRWTNQELAERTIELEQTRQARVRRAVEEERRRVAREMHDVVAYSVTGMVVQAGAARMNVRSSPDVAAHALAAIETLGSEAEAELAQLLGDLREADGDVGGEVRFPDIARIRDLVRAADGVTTRVYLRVDGAMKPLGPGLELSVYRIVQEALTNVRKHAIGASAQVDIRYDERFLELDVSDEGGVSSRQTRPLTGTGQGLIGMRERVALFGGELAAGPRPGGGFRVWVRLPLDIEAADRIPQPTSPLVGTT